MKAPVARAGAVMPGAIGRGAVVLRGNVLLAFAWVAVLCASMVVGISLRPLAEPDEGRNAEIAREMLVTGDYALPQLNHLPHVDMPPVYSMLIAGSFALLGQTEAAARVPGLVATLLTALLTGLFARRLFGRDAGLLAAGALLVAPLSWACGQIVILDAVFTLLITASIMSFHLAIEASPRAPGAPRAMWSVFAWGCIGIAVLTKGPVGALLPLLVMIPYAAWRRSWGAVLDWRGVLLAAAVVGPWVFLVGPRVPDLLHYVVVAETWQRMTGGTLQRSKPFWYFIPLLLAGAFPWSALALAALKRAWTARLHDPRWMLVTLWILLPVVFFSLSSSRLPHHVLPVVPAFALLAAGLWTSTKEGVLPGLRGASWAWLMVGAACIVAIALPAVRNLPEPFNSEALALPLVGAAACAAGVAGLRLGKVAPLNAAWILTVPLLVLYFGGQTFLVSLSDALSSRVLARAVVQAVPANSRIIGAHAFPPAMPFYLGRPIEVASSDASELTSNYLSATYPRWIGPRSTLHPADYWLRVLDACPADTVFVARAGDRVVRAVLAARLPQLTQNARYVVYGPCRRVTPATPLAPGVTVPERSPNQGETSGGIRVADDRPAASGVFPCPFPGAWDREPVGPAQPDLAGAPAAHSRQPGRVSVCDLQG